MGAGDKVLMTQQNHTASLWVRVRAVGDIA